jgi:ring-1,2-phenylacetyl-CoA epoxidase subunit PaaE
MLRTYILPLSDVIHETSEAVTLRMAQPLVDRVNYLPGQYLTLKVNIDGESHYRSYSLSSTPQLDRYLAVTVKRLPGGLVSNHINDHFAPGQLVEFLRPAGHFVLEAATQQRRHLVLIGAGSGITPLMGILRAVLYQEPYSRVSLLYANRSVATVIFRERLETLAETFPQRFALRHILSQPAADTPLPHHAGHLTAAQLPALLAQVAPESALPREYYLCGPQGLLDAAQAGLHALGVPDADIHQERFVANEEITAPQAALSGPTRWVTLRMGDALHQVKVPPGTTVLQAALAQGVRLPYSCRRGICSTCMSTLEQGKVEMDHPESLLDFEVQKGRVLTCQAHPMTDDVRIRVGD